ncbi:MAG: hypothetical protein ACXABY_10340 [Candidatus Thorarchaeota archaeon]|jgi:hypothetical protein
MDAFTSDELARLRSQPQHFRPKLAVFNPTVVWSGTLNGSHDKGARVLTVTTSTGSIDDILTDTTLLVGVGIRQERLRIKAASGSTITLSENPVDWEDGQQLSALLYFELHPVFNRIVNNSGVISYFEDFDVNYTDENSVFSPVVNMGPAAEVVELECGSGTFATLEKEPLDSFVFDATITSYSWDVLRPGDYGIAPTVTQLGDVATFTFYEAGDYYVSCTATANNGKSYTGYRPVLVRCNTDGLDGSPYYDFSVTSLQGSRDAGYWSASISIFEDCNESDFPRNSIVAIYGTAAYGTGIDRSTEQIPWHYTNSANVRFVGWIREEVWIDEYKNKGVGLSFEAVGLCGLLDELQNYPAWLRYVESPTEWTEMPGLTVDKMIYYYLRHRSTILRFTDWHNTGDTKLSNYAEIPNGRMFSGLREFLTGTIYATMASDRVSALWTELDGQLVQDASRSSVVTNVHSSTDEDHMNEITIPTTRDRPEVSWLSIDGLHFDGVENTPRISYAPGYVISPKGGDVETTSGLILPSTQAELNTLAGRLFALRNNPHKDINYRTQGVYPYDIAPQASIRYSELQSGTFREETIIDADLLIQAITDEFTPDLGMTSILDLEMLIRDQGALVGPNVPTAIGGVEGVFPPDPEGIDPGAYGTNWPNPIWNWPEWTAPTATGPEFPIGIPAGTATIAAFNSDGYIYLTSTFDQTTPVWWRVDMSSGWEIGEIFLKMEVDPGSPFNLGTGLEANCWIVTQFSIYYITDVFNKGSGRSIDKQHDFNVQGSSFTGKSIHAQRSTAGKCVVTFYNRNDATYPGTWAAWTDDRGATWNEVQVSEYFKGGVAAAWPGVHVSYKVDGLVYTSGYTDTVNRVALYKSEDLGATWAELVEYNFDADRPVLDIHCPPDAPSGNPTDSLMYHNLQLPAQQLSLRTYDVDTGIGADITPLAFHAGRWGGRWTIHSYPWDGDIMVIHTTRIGIDTSTLWTSIDGGDNWTSKQSYLVGGPQARHAGIAGDDQNVGYICGTEGLIEYTDDFFVTVQDKNGNIDADFPGRAEFHFLMGG